MEEKEKFTITLTLTQEQINELGALIFNEEMQSMGATEVYDLLVNAAGEAGADLP